MVATYVWVQHRYTELISLVGDLVLMGHLLMVTGGGGAGLVTGDGIYHSPPAPHPAKVRVPKRAECRGRRWWVVCTALARGAAPVGAKIGRRGALVHF